MESLCCGPCLQRRGDATVVRMEEAGTFTVTAFDYNVVELRPEFPTYALPARHVLELALFQKHEDLLDDLVIWSSEKGQLMFISHAWTSYQHPDPTGVQLRVLQNLIRNLEDEVRVHREAYAKTANLKVKPTDMSDASKVLVWLDYWSISQDNTANKLKGIASIAAYVQCSAIMFVIVPTLSHHDNGKTCDYAAYNRRGWCRLEKLAFFLKDYRKGVKPEIYVMTGDRESDLRESQLTTSIVWNPEVGIFNADFTCCALNHRLNGNLIPCDMQTLVPVVGTMYQSACEKARRSGDVPLFRKMLAHKWTLYDGLDEVTSPIRDCTSVRAFLEEYRLTDVSSRTDSGHTALHYAAWANDSSIVKLLVGAKADMETKDNDGDVPLVAGIFSNSLASLASLLECRASVATSRPYCVAASMNRKDALELILHAKADPNGRTPTDHPMPLVRDSTGLLTAARRGFPDIVALLLESRADVEAKTGPTNAHANSTALDMARAGGHSEVVAMLESVLVPSRGGHGGGAASQAGAPSGCAEAGVPPSDRGGADRGPQRGSFPRKWTKPWKRASRG